MLQFSERCVTEEFSNVRAFFSFMFPVWQGPDSHIISFSINIQKEITDEEQWTRGFVSISKSTFQWGPFKPHCFRIRPAIQS